MQGLSVQKTTNIIEKFKSAAYTMLMNYKVQFCNILYKLIKCNLVRP